MHDFNTKTVGGRWKNILLMDLYYSNEIEKRYLHQKVWEKFEIQMNRITNNLQNILIRNTKLWCEDQYFS